MRKEEEYIISESQEISVGESLLVKKFFSAFPALTHKNYRLYFTGQMISLIGTWLQQVAQGWLVLSITHSALQVGIVAALANIPVLIFSIFGGVVVDRFSRKKILIFTQSLLLFLAFILGVLTVFNIITILEIQILAFLLGLVTALDMPARQAFVVELVERKNLSSAIALNAGTFNGARALGPAVAGLLIAAYGVGVAFLLNAFSYLAVIIALNLIRIKDSLEKKHPHPIKAIKDGISYSFSNQAIRTLLIFTCLGAIFEWSSTTIMPVVVKDVFHEEASVLGYFYSAVGLGAFLATLSVSFFSQKIYPKKFIFVGCLLFSVSLFIFSFVRSIPLALLFLFLSGFGLLLQFPVINSWLQHTVPNQMRGRVMSIYTIMFVGMMPLGSFLIGLIAQNFGSIAALKIYAIISFALGIIFYFTKGLSSERQ